ncbi:hypothetical protein WCLP8_2780011 [uncultured Gammaproteobacteria bacterium]
MAGWKYFLPQAPLRSAIMGLDALLIAATVVFFASQVYGSH